MSDKAAVLSFINVQNRPFNAQAIAEGMKLKKGDIQKHLDSLEVGEKINVKLFGNVKIYLARQDQFEAPTLEQLANMDHRIAEMSAELSDITSEKKALYTSIANIENEPSNKEVEEQLEKLETEIEAMEEKLKKITEGTTGISADDKKKIETRYNNLRQQWRKRKRLFNDALNEMLSNSDKKPSEIRAEIGVTTDEDAGVTLGEDLLGKRTRY